MTMCERERSRFLTLNVIISTGYLSDIYLLVLQPLRNDLNPSIKYIGETLYCGLPGSPLLACLRAGEIRCSAYSSRVACCSLSQDYQ